MKKWLILLCALVTVTAFASEEVVRKKIKVGGYLWSPFIELQGRNYQGFTLDLIDAANTVQGDFEFEFVLTTPEDRHKDFYNNKFDMIFLEDVDWGWNAYPVNVSAPLAKGTELYIALQETGRTQMFFQAMNEKTISLVRGFHYAFAGNNTNEGYLKQHFKVRFQEDPKDVLEDVLNGKSEIGVINSLTLQAAIAANPKIQKNLLIGKKFDQDFVLNILSRKTSPMTVEQVNLMLDRLNKEGHLAQLWEKYKMDPKIK